MAKPIHNKVSSPRENRSQSFEKYWDEKSVEVGLHNGTLFEVNLIFLLYLLVLFFHLFH